MNILGINCFSHDTAAALVQDGVPVAFVEEERFNREKHTKAFPDEAIRFCLDAAGIGIGEVDTVAFAHRAGVDYLRGAADAIPRLPMGVKRRIRRSLPDPTTRPSWAADATGWLMGFNSSAILINSYCCPMCKQWRCRDR